MIDKLQLKIRGIGAPPSFKNGKVLVLVRGLHRLVTRADRRKWMNQAIRQFEDQRRLLGLRKAERNEGKWDKYNCPDALNVSVHVTWGGGGRLADPDGMLSTIMDCLVRAGVLADDSPRYIKAASVVWHWNPDEDTWIGITIWQETQKETDWYAEERKERQAKKNEQQEKG